MSFNITHDYETYCFLKASLPKGYQIIAEPSKNYYSEWFFDYKIYYKNKLVGELIGDFRDIKDGELVKKAKQILNEAIDDNRK